MIGDLSRRTLLFVLVFTAADVSAEDGEARVRRDLTYAKVDGQTLKLDLHLPQTSRVKPPLVVWIHGGGWRGGSKKRVPLANLVDSGYAVASVEYRFTDKAIFPAQIHDCKAAVRWLRAKADDYGYDARWIAVAGSSAGGHLALLMATSGDVEPLEGTVGDHLNHSSRVQAVVDYFGPSDFVLRGKTHPERAYTEKSGSYALLGGIRDGRVDPELERIASPAHYVSPDDPPLLIFHGADDQVVLPDQSGRMVKVYGQFGLDVHLVTIEGAGHGGSKFFSAQHLATVRTFLDQQRRQRAAMNRFRFLDLCTMLAAAPHPPASATRSTFRLTLIACLILLRFATTVTADPGPGDVYREYLYTNTYGDAGGALRVGGKRGVAYPDRGSDFGYINAWVPFPHKLDLQHAVAAEVVVEKVLSHNGTRGLAIQWNESEWMALPEPAAIAEPRENHYHHTCITISIPLTALRANEEANRFRLRVSPQHGWNWPQHLIYGVHLRVYYDATEKSHVAARVSSPMSGQAIGRSVPLQIEIPDRHRRVDRVDYLGNYEGVNWEGDGQYRRWHYFYYHGRLCHHLGSTVVAPFDQHWDTSWVPDQSEPLEIAARIVDDTGLIFMTPAVNDLRLKRPGWSVELCKPADVPENWVTRAGTFEQSVQIAGNLRQAVAARLVWSSWSPGYMNGVNINDTRVLDVEGPKYRYFDHEVDLPELSALKSGKNLISTGKTPLHGGKMVHGMEVNWPGIQLLIQYDVSSR